MQGPVAVARDLSAPSFAALFQAQVTARGAAPAMFFKAGGRWVPISWAEYALAVRRLANALLCWGVTAGDKVAIWSINRPEWHVADLAAAHCGAASVGLYPTLAAAQMEYQLNHSEAKVVVVQGMAEAGRLLALRSQLRSVIRVVVMDGHDGSLSEWGASWSEALNVGEAFGRTRPGLFEGCWRSVAPDDDYTLIYTSGTTGPSKGAIVTHRNFLWTIDRTMEATPLTGSDRLFSYLPLAHIAERVGSQGRHVRSGCQVHFGSIDTLVADLREVQPTYFLGVPRVYEKIYAGIRAKMGQTTGARRVILDWALRAGARATAAKQADRRVGPMLRAELTLADRLVFHPIRTSLGFDRVRGFGVAAAPISPDILRFFDTIGMEIDEIYGQTEDTGPATWNPMGRPRFGTVGIAIPGTDVKLAEDGEILVRGPHVFKGYYKMPEETAAVLKDGWLHTGDIGEFDGQGYLRLTDRKKELIKTAGGKYVSPAAIEAALREHDLISQAAVIGDRRPYVTALLTLNPDALGKLAKVQGLGTSLPGLLQAPAVQAELQRAIDGVNTNLSHPEQVKRWAVLPGDFVIGDELTPTAKLKRKVVAEKYAKQIEDLYPTSDRAVS